MRLNPCILLVIAALALASSTRPATAAEVLPPGFDDTVVSTGLVYPTAMTAVPDGRIFICQQWGKVRVFKNGTLLPQEMIAVPADGTGDRGLLGIAVDPDFATNQYVYLYYTEKPASTANDYVRNRVIRFTANGDVAVPGSEVTLIQGDLVYTVFHNGGPLHFGPDGKLYVGMGDGEEGAGAQRMTSLNGKILRINGDGTIPTDNPFYATTTGKYRAIWALGLRDPFSFAFQAGTGRMFIDDVGQNTWEEINAGVAGANYGWPNVEGTVANPAYTDPLYAYHHGNAWPQGACIAGGFFYNPAIATFPSAYVGTYFFLDYSKGWIGTLDADNGNAVASFATGLTGPVGLALGADGSLYYAGYNYNDPASSLHRISFTTVAPTIGSQTVDSPVSVGSPATFTVQATGTQPLSYQWQRAGSPIPGATSASYTIAHVASTDDGVDFSAVVTNAYGTAAGAPLTLTVTSDHPPACSILQPATSATYDAGDTITFSGTASDTEDGSLPPSAYTWSVDFITPDDPIVVMAATSGMVSGSFVVPTQGDPRTDCFYRITLAVTDSASLTSSAVVEIHPRVSSITVATNPAGMGVVLSGFSQRTTPYTVSAVVGQRLLLSAMDPQVLAGTDYAFTSWSDGGAASHDIVVSAVSLTCTASFAPQPPSTGTGSTSGTSAGSSTGTSAASPTASGSATASGGVAGTVATSGGAASGGGCGLGGGLALVGIAMALGLRRPTARRIGTQIASYGSQRLDAWSRRLGVIKDGKDQAPR